jgi:hypothetical protein
MQNATGGGTSILPEDRNDFHGAIVSDLVSVIAHVHASIDLIESAIPAEVPLGYQEIGSNVIVLDDLTPRYASARAALRSCQAHLGAALRFLQNTGTPQSETGTAGAAPPPLRLSGCA